MDRIPLSELGGVFEALGRSDSLESLEAAARALDALGVRAHVDARTLPTPADAEATKPCLTFDAEALEPDAARALESVVLAARRRVETEIDLARVRARMKMLDESGYEGLLVHVGGVVIDVNEPLSEILRAPRDALIGPETMRRCVASEDLPGVLEKMASGFEGSYVITGVRWNGERFRAELQAKEAMLGSKPVRVVAVRDITERERTLVLLRESEARLAELADAIFDLTVLSRRGIIVDILGPIEELLGHPREATIGRPLLDFVEPETVPRAQQVLSEQRVGVYEARIVHANGEVIPMEIVAVYSTLNGERVRVAGLRDLRAAKQAELEKHKLRHEVEKAQRLQSLGVLAGGIAHDFNNLLVGIMGNAEQALIWAEQPRLRSAIRAVLDAGEKAANLTRQMLAYAGRADLGKPVPIDLGALAHDVHRLVATRMSNKATVQFDVEPSVFVSGDRTTLTQVLLNLLTNASDALQDEAGRITVRVRRADTIDAGWEHALGAPVPPPPRVLLEVTDDGVGMDERTAGRIFEPFFSTKDTGHGLGLAACLGIVASHGGALRVRTEPGRGSSFSALLPATEAAPDTSHQATPTSEPCQVLVVDDQPLVREQFRRSLEASGYRVAMAHDGEEALAMLEKTAPGLVVLDVTMPGMDGTEVLHELRRRGSRVPVILTSGYADPVGTAPIERASYQAFLNKPYTQAELHEALRVARRAPEPSG